MQKLTGFLRAIAAAGLLIVAVQNWLAPAVVWGQAGLADVTAAQGISNDLDSGRSSSVGANNDQPVDAEEPASTPSTTDASLDFPQRALTLSFNLGVLLKLIGLVVIFLIWVAAGDWVNRDNQIHGLGWHKWSLIYYLPFLLITFLLFFLPAPTWLRALLMFLTFAFSWVPYVLVHNKNVEPHETVLTGSWWRYAMASMLSSVGIKMSSERKADYEKGVQVDLMAMGAEDASTNSVNLIAARQSPGYLLLKEAIAGIVSRRADKLMLDFTQQGVTVRYEIDGVWHNGEPRDRESSDVMLAVIKTLANLNVKDRKSKQQGQFGAKYEGKTYICPVVTQGVATGERVVISRIGEKQHMAHYEDLGMREGLQKQWAELMGAESGLLIFSSLPGGGLTTMMNVSLEETDRLMRDFAAIEEVSNREHDLQNISVTTYDASKGETPATIIPTLIRTYPNVYVLRDMTDVEAAKLLFKEVQDEHLVVTSIRAKEAAEALLRFLQLKMPAKEFAKVTKGVLYQRLIRKLCTDCKVGYTPSADVLRKLGIPAGKVEQLYRPPKPEEIEKPCKTCQGLGYVGRTGLFELLTVNDKMREILIKQPKLSLLKEAARAARQRSLQEEGILLVAQGTTSLQELTRVLQQ